MHFPAPKTVARSNWGRNATAILDARLPGEYACVAIAADSDAYGVELRPNGSTDFRERVVVTAARPYVGRIAGKGLGIYPLTECPVDPTVVADIRYSHNLKLDFYPVLPPYLASKRAQARFDFQMGAAGVNVMTASAYCPLVPCMGRREIFVNVDFNEVLTADADIVFEGLRCNGNMAAIANLARTTDRWIAPIGVPSGTWAAGAFFPTPAIEVSELETISNVVADASYFRQYAGDFDFLRVSFTENTDTYWARVSVVLND